jgi:hypothetical protein
LATKKAKKPKYYQFEKKKSPFGEIGNEAISEVSIARSEKNSNNHHMSIFGCQCVATKLIRNLYCFIATFG